MHAIHPHVPRAMVAALGAVVLTMLVLLVFAPRAGNISFGSSSGGSASPAATSSRLGGTAQVREPSWLANPLARPFQGRIAFPWSSSVRR